MNEAVSKFLDKIPTDKLYEDLFQPSLKKAGLALETVIDFGNTILLPLKLVNEVSKLRLNQHLVSYEKKLADIADADLHKVPEYVGLPIVDKLLLLDANDLSEAFLNLLAKASTSSTLGLVHPAFIQTLENLSVDEAKILFHFNEAARIPFISLYYKKYKELIKKPETFDSPGPKSSEALKQQINYALQDRDEVNIEAEKYLTEIGFSVPIDFTENVPIYIDNFHRLGLIEFVLEQYHAADNLIYENLESVIHKKTIDEHKEVVNDYTNDTYKLEFVINKGFIVFSKYGQAFLRACLKSLSEAQEG
jgi:hypothetical protein